MTQIVPCRMCKGRKFVENPVVVDEDGRLFWGSCRTPTCRVFGPQRFTEAEAIAAWNELMQPSEQPKPEMQSKTVRVRIPVHYDEGIINVDWVLETDKDKYTADRGGGILVAYVTADIPFPQPVEIHAECKEASDE